MATVKPFKALRYTELAGDPKTYTCPPYDIISESEKKEYLNNNPYNVIRLEKPETGEDIYKTASETLNDFLNNNILALDKTEGFYIYEEEFLYKNKKYNLKGIIGRVHLEEFSKGIVLPHENTLSAAKEDRFNLMKATNCNFSQVYSLYFDEGKETLKFAEENISEKLCEFKDNSGIIHRLYKVENTEKITEDFKDRKLFIADGHHRYETALRYKDYKKTEGSEYIMMMLVPMESDGLVVLPTHRVVHSLENFNANEVLDKCKEYFYIEEIDDFNKANKALEEKYLNGKISFVFYYGKKYCLLTLKNTADLEKVTKTEVKALRELDVSVLHSLILENILKIDKENLAKQINLTYVKAAEDAVDMVKNGADCTFLLNPTKVSQIAEVAKNGAKMPQKSTYFYPKLITGLVMNKLD